MIWIHTGNNVDNKNYLVTVKQTLSGAKAFPDSHNTPPVRKLGVPEKLGGDRGETANPN